MEIVVVPNDSGPKAFCPCTADSKLVRARNPQSLRHPPRGGVTAAGTLAEREPQRPPHTPTVGVVAARRIARSERALTPQQSKYTIYCAPPTKKTLELSDLARVQNLTASESYRVTVRHGVRFPQQHVDGADSRARQGRWRLWWRSSQHMDRLWHVAERAV